MLRLYIHCLSCYTIDLTVVTAMQYKNKNIVKREKCIIYTCITVTRLVYALCHYLLSRQMLCVVNLRTGWLYDLGQRFRWGTCIILAILL
jgi:hypothetical protein